MANLNDMTPTERMNSINGDALDAYTFKEALNRYLILDVHSDYIIVYKDLHQFEPEEALNVILKETDYHKYTVTEALNVLAGGLATVPPSINQWTAQEALNVIETSAKFDDRIP